MSKTPSGQKTIALNKNEEQAHVNKRGVQGVVGMVVAEDHVGHLGGIDPEVPQRSEDQVPVRDHPRIDHDDGVAVADQGHRARHPVVCVAVREHGQSCGHRSSSWIVDPFHAEHAIRSAGRHGLRWWCRPPFTLRGDGKPLDPVGDVGPDAHRGPVELQSVEQRVGASPREPTAPAGAR